MLGIARIYNILLIADNVSQIEKLFLWFTPTCLDERHLDDYRAAIKTEGVSACGPFTAK